MNAASLVPAPALARYRPLFKLGQGGMADVYVAVTRATPGLERLVVVKRLRTDLAGGDEDQDPEQLVAMFRDEARLSVLLKHGNVVHTYDVFEEDGALYLGMELVEGQPLNNVARELARRSVPLSAPHAALIAAEVLAGLQYAHQITDLAGERLEIVHRDVSPQNVLLGFDGVVKLLDFGVAKASFRSAQTRAGTMKGKARYMAPEQVVNRSVDRRADIYSVGVILWELVARKKLVDGATEVEQLMNVLQTSAPRLSSVVPDVSPVLDAIVERALAREPDERYPTAAAMRDALLAYIATDGRARIDDLGRLVTELFPTQCEAMQSTIRARLALPEIDPVDMGEALRRLDAEEALQRTPTSARPKSATVSSASPPTSAVVPIAAPAAPKRRTRALLPLVLVLLGIGVAAGVMTRRAPPKVTAAEIAPAPSGEVPAPEKSEVAPTLPPPTPPTPLVATVPEAPEPTPSTSTSATGPRGSTRPWRTPVPAAPMRSASRDEIGTAAPADAPGYLTLETFPWTKVTVDGRALGATPLVHVSLPAGSHIVTMENVGEGIRESTTVTVKSGETLAKRLAFDK